MRTGILLCCISVLSGCAALAQHRAERQQARIIDAQAVCSAAGIPSNDPRYAECTLMLYQQRTAQAEAASQALIQQGLQILATPPARPQICTGYWSGPQWVSICQ